MKKLIAALLLGAALGSASAICSVTTTTTRRIARPLSNLLPKAAMEKRIRTTIYGLL